MGKVLTDEEFWIVFKDILFGQDRIDKAMEEVDKILELIDVDSGSKILDMPCGIGRHSRILERKGFEVVGVDKTEDYVKDADERTDQAEIVRGDMKDFRREGEFDAVINWWNSFGYFEEKKDDVRMLENINASLVEEGVLLMDVWSKELTAKSNLDQRWNRQNELLHLEEHEIKEDWKKVETTWIKVEEGKVREYTWEKRLYSAAELEQLLQKAGFSKIKFYGDLEASEYNLEADRMIVKAIK